MGDVDYVLTRFEGGGFVIPHRKVTDMSVSAKALNRHIRPLATNSAEDSIKRAARLVESHWVVASEDEQINWILIVDGIDEPLFLDHVSCLDDFRDVAVASEVE